MGVAIRFMHLTFDLDLCRAKKHTMVNGSRAVTLVAVAAVESNS